MSENERSGFLAETFRGQTIWIIIGTTAAYLYLLVHGPLFDGHPSKDSAPGPQQQSIDTPMDPLYEERTSDFDEHRIL
jgi:hypothetical protein